MGLTKDQVREHISGVERRVTNLQERKQYGYEFAKLCYQSKQYNNAIRYLKDYLSVNERDYRAHKWMGRLYDAVGGYEKAIAQYKRSLELKNGQQDAIEAVASLYCKLKEPPVDSMKECLKQILTIRENHPLVLSLSEKIQSMEGGSSMEELIKKSLSVNSSDVNLHIRLVKLYFGSGKFAEAYKFCQDLGMRGDFTDSLDWQTCALDIAENYYEKLRSSGRSDSVSILESLITVLDTNSALFRIVTSPQNESLAQSASLLLKFDKVLCASVHSLRSMPIPLSVFHVAVRELCGRLYLMAGQYLYLAAQRLRQSVLGTTDSESVFQLGDMCLLSSLKATPPNLDSDWSQNDSTRQLIQRWHNAASSRISIAGRHLMLVASKKGRKYFVELPNRVATKGGKLHLIKVLFGGNNQDMRVKFGSQGIGFSLQESFLAGDDSFMSPPVNLPANQELELCDKACVLADGKDLRNVIWLCLAYKALELVPPVFSWLMSMFDGLKFDTPVISSSEPDTLCVCDIEAYVTLLSSMYSHRLTTPTHQLFSVPQSPVPLVKLSAALSLCLPSSLSLEDKHLAHWNALRQFLDKKLSVKAAISVKKLIREFLGFVRGTTSLQLSLDQLTLLARHFKGRAEKATESSDEWNDLDIVATLLKWSSHYWTIIVNVLTSEVQTTKQSVPTLTILSSPKSGEDSALLTEARMALANEALFKQDTNRALRLYSRVKTPHAAWNQSQIYLHLADVPGQTDTPDKLDNKLVNLQKASDTLELAIARLSPTEEGTLRKKLLSQRDEVRNLLGDARKSPLACTLHYEEESPIMPRRSSTPARQTLDSSSLLIKEMEESSPSRVTSALLGGSLVKSMQDKDERLSAMARQLAQLQAEMDEIKSQTMSSNRPSPGMIVSPQGLGQRSPAQAYRSPYQQQVILQSPRFSQHGSPGLGSTPGNQSGLLPSNVSPYQGASPTVSPYAAPGIRAPPPGTSAPFSNGALFSGISPPIHRPPSNVVSPPGGLALPQQLLSHALFTSTQNVLGQPTSQNMTTPLFHPTTLSQFNPSFTLPPTLQPVVSTSGNLFMPSGTSVKPAVKSLFPTTTKLPASESSTPPNAYPAATVSPLFKPAISTSQTPLSPPFSFGAQTTNTVSFNFTGPSSFSFGQPKQPAGPQLFTSSNVSEAIQSSTLPSLAKVMKMSETTTSPSSGFMSQSPANVTSDLTPTTLASSSTTLSIFTVGKDATSSAPLIFGTSQPSIQDATSSAPLIFGTSQPSIQDATSSAPLIFGTSEPPFQDATSSAPLIFGTSQPPIQDATSSAPLIFGTSQPPIQDASSITPLIFGTSQPPIQDATSSAPLIFGTSQPPIQDASSSVFGTSQPSMFSLGQTTTTSLSAPSQTPFQFQDYKPSMSFTNSGSSDTANIPPKPTPSLGDSFPILSSLLGGKATEASPKPLTGGIFSSSATPSFAFSTQTMSTSNTTSTSSTAPSLTALGSSLFSSVNIKDEAAHEEEAEEQESQLDTSNGGPHFTPIVTLPEIDNILSGEENEKLLFVHRAKLYRYQKPEWKERGLGDMKILRHTTTGKARLLMRREQILKICCNHYITPEMSLTPVKGSNRMLAWFTNADFADGQAQAEKLAIKFKTEEIASSFREAFETCLSELIAESVESGSVESEYDSEQPIKEVDSDDEPSEISSSDLSSRLAPPPDSWTCDSCYVTNDKDTNQCVACMARKPGATLPEPFSKFAPPQDNWTCDVCLVSNKKDDSKCIACTTKKPGAQEEYAKVTESFSLSGQSFPLLTSMSGIGGLSAPFSGFKLAPDSLQSASSKTSTPFTALNLMQSSDLSSRLAPPPDSWTCDSCYVTNDKDTNQCVACMARKPGATLPEPFSKFAPPQDNWTCDVCLVSNKKDDSKCIACTTKKPGAQEENAKVTESFSLSGQSFPPLTSMSGIGGLSAPFSGFKLAPDSLQSASSKTSTPFTALNLTQSSDLSSQLAPPPDSWTCDSCYVTNDKDTNQCVACMARKPGATLPEPFSKFAPPQDNWACDVCLVSNKRGDSKCIACAALKPGAKSDNSYTFPPSTVMSGSGAKTIPQGAFKLAPNTLQPAVSTSTAPFSGFKLQTTTASVPFKFAPDSLQTLSTSVPSSGFKLAPNSLKSISESTDSAVRSGGIKLAPNSLKSISESTDSAVPSGGSKLAPNSLESISESTDSAVPSGGFKLAPNSLESTSESTDSAVPSGGFKLAPNSLESTSESTDSSVPFGGFKTPTGSFKLTPTSLVNSSDNTKAKETSTSNVLFGGGKPSYKTPFSFGSGTLSGSPGAFPSFVPAQKEDTEADDDGADQDYEPDVYFKPLVTLPDSVEIQTGEEGSEVLFSHRAKLYRYDLSSTHWKERGIGDIKILKNNENGNIRIVMRRDQVKKICCNHLLTSNMNLTPMAKGDKAWIWYTLNDFADGVSKPEKFAVKFKLPETVQLFKDVFDECVQQLLAEDKGSKDTSIEQSEVTDMEDDVVITHVEMPSPEKVQKAKELMLPITFFNYETKPSCPGCRGCFDQIEGIYLPENPEIDSEVPHTEESSQVNAKATPEPTITETRPSQDDLTTKPFSGSFMGSESVSFSDLASGESSFIFGNKSPGFARAGEVLFGSKVGTQSVDENPESEADVQFAPVVTLPDVEVKTGEESDEMLFSHRAKLFRFDSKLVQWKERGVGDIKIMRNVKTSKARVIMRRDQIRKVCCNHSITPDMNLTPNQGSDKSLVWYTPCDYSNEEATPENLAVRFKHSEKAAEFKKVFDSCKTFVPEKTLKADVNEDVVLEKEEVINSEEVGKEASERASMEERSSPVEDSGESDLIHKFAPPPGSWTCDVCYVSNAQTSSKCVACGYVQERTPTPSSTPPPSAVTDLENVNICSPDSSANRNPLLRFPLEMSPATTQPYISTKSPPALYSPQVDYSETEDVLVQTETVSVEETDTHQDDCKNTMEDSNQIDTRETTTIKELSINTQSELLRFPLEMSPVSKVPYVCTKPPPALFSPKDDSFETEEIVPKLETIADDTNQDGCESLEPDHQKVDMRETDSDNSVGSNTDNEQPTDDDDVIFLYEELPEEPLVAKAKDLMLPPSFFLYEKKEPCLGCRGCKDEIVNLLSPCVLEQVSSLKEDEVLSETNVSPVADTTLSDKHPSSDLIPAEKQTGSGQFSQQGLLSFSDLAPDTSSFAQRTSGFQFQGAGKQLFTAAPTDEDFDPEKEADVTFKPIVTLPEVASRKSWEDDADTLFANRGKLFRFDTSVNQWKERGVGDMKIFCHKENRRVRIIMRRDQIMKICCNHYITAGMTLMPGSNDKSWVWFTQSDLTDEEPKPEKLAIRFKHAETAHRFKKVFEECVSMERSETPTTESSHREVHQSEQFNSSKPELFASSKPEPGSWTCTACYVVNKETDNSCIACQTPSTIHDVDAKSEADVNKDCSEEGRNIHATEASGFKLSSNLEDLKKKELSGTTEMQPINLTAVKFGNQSIDKPGTDIVN